MKKSFDSNVKVGQGNKTAVLLLIFKEVICKSSHKPKALEVIFISFDPSKHGYYFY
jgi:hypothetical protein